MVLINTTSPIGAMFETITANVTGNLFLSLLLMTLLLHFIFAVLKIPQQISILLIIPFCILSILLTSQYLPILGFIIMYLSILFASKFWLN